jgi:hypothetical protein
MNLSFRRQMVTLADQVLDGLTFLVACWRESRHSGRMRSPLTQLGVFRFTDFRPAGGPGRAAFDTPRSMRRFERFSRKT